MLCIINYSTWYIRHQQTVKSTLVLDTINHWLIETLHSIQKKHAVDWGSTLAYMYYFLSAVLGYQQERITGLLAVFSINDQVHILTNICLFYPYVPFNNMFCNILLKCLSNSVILKCLVNLNVPDKQSASSYNAKCSAGNKVI